MSKIWYKAYVTIKLSYMLFIGAHKEGARDQSINHQGNILCFTFDVQWENYKMIKS